MSAPVFSTQGLHKSKYLKDCNVLDDSKTFGCSIILGLGLNDGKNQRELLSKTSQFFEEMETPEDGLDNLDQIQEAVRKTGSRLNYAIHLFFDLGDVVELQSVALQASKDYTADKVIPLLRVCTNSRFGFRFLLITNLTAFMRRVRRKGEPDTNRGNQLCFRCLWSFTSKKVLLMHQKACKVYSLDIDQGPPTFIPEIIMPTGQGDKPPFKEFTNIEATIKGSIVVYADFETAITPEHTPCSLCHHERSLKGGRCRCPNDEHRSFTVKTHQHKALAYSFAALDHAGQVILTRQELTEEGKAGEAFINALLEVEPLLQDMMNQNKPLIENYDEIQNLPFQETCSICDEAFTNFDVFTGNQHELPEKFERIVRHHEHHTGKHRGIKHMECLPKNSQRLRTFRFSSFELVDSLAHLSSSLGELSQTLHQTNHHYPILRQSPLCRDDQGRFSQERMNYLLKKLHFPYEMITSTSVLTDTTQIPKRDKFYSSLTNEITVTEEEYRETQETYQFFNCKNLAEFLLIYLWVDVYLLMEVCFAYQETIFDWLGLYAWNYMSMPGLAFDGFLKHSGVRLELLQQQEDYELFEKGCRGGLSYTSKRLAEEVDGDIIYVDFNSMYCSCMTEPLALDSFRWLSQREIDNFDIDSIDPLPDGGTAYVLEVDLSYPPELCLQHSDVPLCPQRTEIREDDLSPYTRQLLKLQDGKEKVNAKRLICPMDSRKNYLTTAQNLKMYLALGIKLEKIHKIFSYRSQSFAKGFMQECADQRARARSDFHKRFYKLVANSCYGRLLLGVRDFKDMKIQKDRKLADKWISCPRMTNVMQVDELTLIMLQPKKVLLNSLVVNGFLVLERAKYHLFSSYYFGFSKIWPGLEVILSDTDSFVFQLPKTANLRQDLQHPILKDMMDYSNLDPQDPLYDPSRSGLLRWKIEKGLKKTVKSVCCLRPKCYAIQWKKANGELEPETKCKGINRAIASSTLRFQQYKEALLEGKKTYAEYSAIRCINFQLNSVRMRKCALASSCISRYFFPCGIHSCPLKSPEIQVFGGECRKCQGLSQEDQEERLNEWCRANSY